jgi:hypothetical protein
MIEKGSARLLRSVKRRAGSGKPHWASVGGDASATMCLHWLRMTGPSDMGNLDEAFFI